MAYQGISTGTTPNDNTGDSLFAGAIKINSNFTELYTALGDGSTINLDTKVVTTSGAQIVGGAKTFTSTVTTQQSFVGNGTIPIGGIIMWSGTIANIPTGWALCDGTNSTPDLRNRFIVGAHSGAGIGTVSTAGPGFNASTGALNSNYTPGNSGGETAHRLTIPELAAHTHTYGYPNSNPVNGAPDTETISAFNLSNTGTTGSTGGDNYHENRPPYYALAFIMRTT